MSHLPRNHIDDQGRAGQLGAVPDHRHACGSNRGHDTRRLPGGFFHCVFLTSQLGGGFGRRHFSPIHSLRGGSSPDLREGGRLSLRLTATFSSGGPARGAHFAASGCRPLNFNIALRHWLRRLPRRGRK